MKPSAERRKIRPIRAASSFPSKYSIITKNKMYLSLNNGRLVVIDTSSGKPIDIIKIDSEKISRPYVTDNNMFIVRDNAIIKLN